jgi:hypothetical protein
MTLAALALTLAPVVVHDDGVVVRERRAADVDDVRIDDATDPEALLAVPGVSLLQSGGPLAPVRPLVRGLSGPRLSATVLGVPFVDPAAGDVDAGLFPFWLGSVDVDVGAGSGVAGAFSFKRSDDDGVRARVEVGSLSTLTGGARVVDRDVGGRSGDVVGAAVFGGISAGDFVFVDDNGQVAVRDNNDQVRGSALVFGNVKAVDGVRVHGAAVASLHEGGIPGFATAPLLLRGRRSLGAAGVGVTTRGEVGFDVDAFASASERATGPAGVGNSSFRTQIDDDGVSRLVGTRVGGRARARAEITDDIDVTAAVNAAASALPDLDDPRKGRGSVQRLEAGSQVAARARGGAGTLLGAPLTFVVDGDAAGQIVDDVSAFLLTGHLRLGVRRRGAFVFVQAARAARAPTLDERFAPQGFVEGNPTLTPESATEGEAGVVVDVFDGVDGVDGVGARVRVVGHASSLDETIVVVARSAFQLVPVNAGPAERAGVDVGFTLTPHPIVSLDVAASALSSRFLRTNAPLPGAPAFVGRASVTVGDVVDAGSAAGDLGPRVSLVFTGKSSSSANQFGTQRADPNLLVDLVGRYPIGTGLALTARIDNAFDVVTAEDTLLLPLPGRLVFFGLEVRS